MGQLSSMQCLLPQCAPSKPKRPLSNATLQPPPSLFLQLPVDLVLYLCREHLGPASVVTLSLTCKELLCLVSSRAPVTLSDSGRRELLRLLERDLGHGWWYCDCCCALHRITAWRPITRINESRTNSIDRYHDRLKLGGFTIDYQLLRLAMNRHFHGPPNGLPLENFEVRAVVIGRVRWQERWSARILQDELFLSAHHTLSGIYLTDTELRAALEVCSYSICNHVGTHLYAGCTVYALLRQNVQDASTITPCHNVVESCSRCLTDYATTVERRSEELKDRWGKKRTVAYWLITITSYHRLGSGRTPFDAKWQMFAGRLPRGSKLPSRLKRDMEEYPPGAVKAAWEKGDQPEPQQLRTT